MARDLKEVFRDESLEPPPEPDVDEAWAAEAERRWREIESGAVDTIPWEEVRAKLFPRYY